MSKATRDPFLVQWDWAILLIVLVLFVSWAGYLVFSQPVPAGLSAGMERPAWNLIGDAFNSLNVVFSGLAFAALVITLWMQREELKLQRQEMKESLELQARTNILQAYLSEEELSQRELSWQRTQKISSVIRQLEKQVPEIKVDLDRREQVFDQLQKMHNDLVQHFDEKWRKGGQSLEMLQDEIKQAIAADPRGSLMDATFYSEEVPMVIMIHSITQVLRHRHGDPWTADEPR